MRAPLLLLLITAAVVAPVAGVCAAVVPPAATVTSHTGRFVVTARPRPPRSPAEQAAQAAAGLVELDPRMTAVSCEKIREALGRSLGVASLGGPRIYVTIAPVAEAGRVPQVVSTLYRDGWQHRITLPTPVEEAAVVRCVVNVLLLQVAERNQTVAPAEIPLWLATGLALHVQASNPPLLVRPDLRLNREGRLADPLERVRTVLLRRPALSFDELSWPTAADLTGERREAFERSAQLFVHQLLQLRDGPALCRRFLAELSRHLNWQTAFLRVYAAQFPTLLAVEKWWAVHLTQFTGRDEWRMWPLETALARLDEAVRIPTQVRADTNSLPASGSVSLQTVLAEWSGARQRAALQAAIQQLARVRLNAPPPVARVVDGYLEVLDKAGRRQATGGLGRLPATRATEGASTARDLLRRLEALDAERAALHALRHQAARSSQAP
jgi:hypothetical protein